MVQLYYSAKHLHNILGRAPPSPLPFVARYPSDPTSRMLTNCSALKLLFRPFWSCCCWVLTIRLQQLCLRMRHYCMRSLLCSRHNGSSFPNFDRDFLQATKCAFLQPQKKSCGWQLSSEFPGSIIFSCFYCWSNDWTTRRGSYGIFARVGWPNIGLVATRPAGPVPTALLCTPLWKFWLQYLI